MVDLLGGRGPKKVSRPVPGQPHAAKRTWTRRDDVVPGHRGPEGPQGIPDRLQRLTVATYMDGGPPPPARRKLRVLRLCSVFEPPATALAAAGARYDPVG